MGVHHVAVTAGRALRRGGVPLDLALVSGSAIGHDIGKFGCHPGERVPYLHYYYTDQWFRRRRKMCIRDRPAGCESSVIIFRGGVYVAKNTLRGESVSKWAKSPFGRAGRSEILLSKKGIALF